MSEATGAGGGGGQVEVALHLQGGYRFRAELAADGAGDFPPLLMDEPAPLGEGAGPNAARVLAAAVADCLSASLLFCLRKARLDVADVSAVARAELTRNERGRLRVGGIHVTISPRLHGEAARLGRCLELFEDYCVVTDSVRHGLPVTVDVAPQILDEPPPAAPGS